MNLKFYKELPEGVLGYTKSLRKKDLFQFLPTQKGLTRYGTTLELGFSCYALKIYYMTGAINNFETQEIEDWVNFINSFQKITKSFNNGFYFDPVYINYYEKRFSKESLTSTAKLFLNKVSHKDFDSKKIKLFKGINAETKQAIATLKEVGYDSKYEFKIEYGNDNNLTSYLSTLDWSKPWSAGGQFSSYCLYSTNNHELKKYLYDFVTKLSDPNTGSYFSKTPIHQREIINGAMKVISGLDWLDEEIHYPKNLINFCLNNRPILEGCDIVDYVYVLYKCSKQTDYKKDKINQLFKELLSEMLKLFNLRDNSFSYFFNKSQTHYYGVKITKGFNTADLHGSLLSLWAVLMMLDSLEEKDEKYKIIKP